VASVPARHGAMAGFPGHRGPLPARPPGRGCQQVQPGPAGPPGLRRPVLLLASALASGRRPRRPGRRDRVRLRPRRSWPGTDRLGSNLVLPGDAGHPRRPGPGGRSDPDFPGDRGRVRGPHLRTDQGAPPLPAQGDRAGPARREQAPAFRQSSPGSRRTTGGLNDREEAGMSARSCGWEPLRRGEGVGLWLLLCVIFLFGVLVEYRSVFLQRRMTDLNCYLRAGWAVRQGGADLYHTSDDNGWHYNYPPLYAILLAPLADPPTHYWTR